MAHFVSTMVPVFPIRLNSILPVFVCRDSQAKHVKYPSRFACLSLAEMVVLAWYPVKPLPASVHKVLPESFVKPMSTSVRRNRVAMEALASITEADFRAIVSPAIRAFIVRRMWTSVDPILASMVAAVWTRLRSMDLLVCVPVDTVVSCVKSTHYVHRFPVEMAVPVNRMETTQFVA
jgi:hypothetical protein